MYWNGGDRGLHADGTLNHIGVWAVMHLAWCMARYIF
jgi:hypothetical protein